MDLALVLGLKKIVLVLFLRLAQIFMMKTEIVKKNVLLKKLVLNATKSWYNMPLEAVLTKLK